MARLKIFEELKNGKVKIECECPFCGKKSYVEVYSWDVDAYNKGSLVSTAFPYLKIDEREKLISGTCDKCWDTYMKCE